MRRAERVDLPEVHRLEQSVFPQPWPLAAFEQYLGRPGFLVADDGGVVGYVVADLTEGHGRSMGHVKDLAVSLNRRREGIGSLLLTRAITVLEGRTDAVKLEVRENNAGAIHLYRQHGFSFRRRLSGYYANGEDALVLVRPV